MIEALNADLLAFEQFIREQLAPHMFLFVVFIGGYFCGWLGCYIDGYQW